MTETGNVIGNKSAIPAASNEEISHIHGQD
jgi:hypothetical protein